MSVLVLPRRKTATCLLRRSGFVLLSIFLLPLAPLTVSAEQATLTWGASPSANVGGYRVYYGPTSRNYTSVVDVGRRTVYTLSGLQTGRIYYFAVTAYNRAKTQESPFSNEVWVKAGFPPPLFSDSFE